MRVFINLYNLNSGGGKTIAEGIMHELDTTNSTSQFFVLLPKDEKRTGFKSKNVNVVQIPEHYFKGLFKLFIGQKIAKVCAELKIDRILNLTNYPVPTDIAQSLLIQWPYLVYSDRDLWSRMSFWHKMKRYINRYRIGRKIHLVKDLMVQTPIMQKKLSCTFPKLADRIRVIEAFHNMDITMEIGNSDTKAVTKFREGKAVQKLVFLSKHYEHKNHDILKEVGDIIEQKKLPIRIYTTLQQGLPLLSEIESNSIINLGPLAASEIKTILPESDGLFFPVLVETFGIPYIEAMYFNIPIYTSNRDFSSAVCGEYAYYFDPLDPKDIINCITQNNGLSLNKKPDFRTRKEIVGELFSL